MRAALIALALLVAGCAAPSAPRAEAGPAVPDDGGAPPLKLLNCTVEHRFLAPEGFVKGRARLDHVAWPWGLNPVPAAQDTVPTRLKVPVMDALPAGWSALAVGLQVRTHTGTVAVPPLAQAPIILTDPATYVSFPSPMPPGYQGGARSIHFAFDDSTLVAGTLAFDSTFLTTGANGLDLALTSDPGMKDAQGHERLTRLDAFYCHGERLALQDFLGYDFDTDSYER